MLEEMGYKGWFESGNSLSAILILSMFIILNIFNKKNIGQKVKIWTSIIITLIGLFLMLLIGTRVGLYGFILVLGIYVISHIIYNLINKKNVKQTLIVTAIIILLGLVAVIIIFKIVGSTTIERRQKVEEMANQLTENYREEVHITGDMLEIKNKIENGTLEKNYMSEEQQQALISLNEIATEKGLSVEQMRSLQLIYNIELVKYQSNPIYMLFGNGYMSQYRETVLEMEIPALIMNFGIYGFTLYLIPFLLIYVWAIYKKIKNIKKIDKEDIMLITGGGLAFVLSFLSGYVFFNASTAMIIIIINTQLVIKVRKE